MQERLWKSRCFMYAFCSQYCSCHCGHCGRYYDSVFIFTRFWCTPTQVQSKPSTKLARIYDVDLIQFLSGWLTYRADNVKTRIPRRVWKMFGCHVIKHYEMHFKSYKCPLYKLAYVWPTQSTQSVKTIVWKGSHNLFSQRLCRFPQLKTTVD